LNNVNGSSIGIHPAWITPNMTCVLENWDACGKPAWLLLDKGIKAWNCLGLCFDERLLNSSALSCSRLSSCYSDPLREALLEQKVAVFGLEHFATSLVMLKQKRIDTILFCIGRIS